MPGHQTVVGLAVDGERTRHPVEGDADKASGLGRRNPIGILQRRERRRQAEAGGLMAGKAGGIVNGFAGREGGLVSRRGGGVRSARTKGSRMWNRAGPGGSAVASSARAAPVVRTMTTKDAARRSERCIETLPT